MATKTTEAPEAPEAREDAPLLDLSDAAVKRMIARAKQRGYVTFEELNEVLPAGFDQHRADRRHDGDAVRDGHQCHRGR